MTGFVLQGHICANCYKMYWWWAQNRSSDSCSYRLTSPHWYECDMKMIFKTWNKEHHPWDKPDICWTNHEPDPDWSDLTAPPAGSTGAHTHTHTHTHTQTQTQTQTQKNRHKQSSFLTHTHTHTHSHVGFAILVGTLIGVMVFLLYRPYILLPYTNPTPKLSLTGDFFAFLHFKINFI